MAININRRYTKVHSLIDFMLYYNMHIRPIIFNTPFEIGCVLVLSLKFFLLRPDLLYVDKYYACYVLWKKHALKSLFR